MQLCRNHTSHILSTLHRYIRRCAPSSLHSHRIGEMTLVPIKEKNTHCECPLRAIEMSVTASFGTWDEAALESEMWVEMCPRLTSCCPCEVKSSVRSNPHGFMVGLSPFTECFLKEGDFIIIIIVVVIRSCYVVVGRSKKNHVFKGATLFPTRCECD